MIKLALNALFKDTTERRRTITRELENRVSNLISTLNDIINNVQERLKKGLEYSSQIRNKRGRRTNITSDGDGISTER
ncbi:MAG: hypothetical protein ACE5EA_03440 [Nitrospirota bacterium]